MLTPTINYLQVIACEHDMTQQIEIRAIGKTTKMAKKHMKAYLYTIQVK